MTISLTNLNIKIVSKKMHATITPPANWKWLKNTSFHFNLLHSNLQHSNLNTSITAPSNLKMVYKHYHLRRPSASWRWFLKWKNGCGCARETLIASITSAIAADVSSENGRRETPLRIDDLIAIDLSSHLKSKRLPWNWNAASTFLLVVLTLQFALWGNVCPT